MLIHLLREPALLRLELILVDHAVVAERLESAEALLDLPSYEILFRHSGCPAAWRGVKGANEALVRRHSAQHTLDVWCSGAVKNAAALLAVVA